MQTTALDRAATGEWRYGDFVRGKVNCETGIVPGVKILGLKSRNGRRYDESAVRAAASKYEGAAVHVDHAKTSGARSYRDRIGTLRNVRFANGRGLIGDLHLNKAHALYPQIVADANAATPGVGLSHNIYGRSTTIGGEQVITEIDKVTSVDLVSGPATNDTLFEHAMQEQFVESITGEPSADTLDAFVRRITGRPSAEELRAFAEAINDDGGRDDD